MFKIYAAYVLALRYPAGHLYIYTLLSALTDQGTNLRRAQIIFAYLFVLNVGVILRIYQKAAREVVFILLKAHVRGLTCMQNPCKGAAAHATRVILLRVSCALN